jgi:hypothetical protein
MIFMGFKKQEFDKEYPVGSKKKVQIPELEND